MKRKRIEVKDGVTDRQYYLQVALYGLNLGVNCWPVKKKPKNTENERGRNQSINVKNGCNVYYYNLIAPHVSWITHLAGSGRNYSAKF